MKIKDFNLEKDGQMYVLKVIFDGKISQDWINSYNKAIRQSSKAFTSIRGSGAPTINKIEFVDDYAISDPFSRHAISDISDFMKEFEFFVDLANQTFENLEIQNKKKEERLEEEKSKEEAELEELNDILHKNVKLK